MALANGGPQDVRRGLAGDREFLGKVLDIDRPPGRCIRRGVHEREIAGLEPSRVPEEVQAGDEEEESAQRRGRDTDQLLKHRPGGREDPPDAGKGQRNRAEQVVQGSAVHANSVPSIDDEGPAKRFAQDRGSERGRIPTVDDAQRGPVSRDHPGGDGVEYDAGAGGLVARPREVDEVPKGHPLEQPRLRVLSRVGRVHAGDGRRVHDAGGMDAPSERCAHPIRRVTGARARHDDDRMAASELRGLRVSRRGLSVRAATQSRREQPPGEPRDRDAELIERPFTDAETPARLDVIPGNPPAAGHDEELHAPRNVPQQLREIPQIPGVVVAGNEDGSAQRNDDFLHVNAVSTQKVMNDLNTSPLSWHSSASIDGQFCSVTFGEVRDCWTTWSASGSTYSLKRTEPTSLRRSRLEESFAG